MLELALLLPFFSSRNSCSPGEKIPRSLSVVHTTIITPPPPPTERKERLLLPPETAGKLREGRRKEIPASSSTAEGAGEGKERERKGVLCVNGKRREGRGHLSLL